MLNSLDLILARFCRRIFISLVVHKCRMAMAHAFLYHSAERPEVLKHPSSAVIAFFRIVEAPIKRCHRILQRTIGGIHRKILNPLCANIVASFPGSDGKLGGAWDRGYEYCAPVHDLLVNCVRGYNIHYRIFWYGDTFIRGYRIHHDTGLTVHSKLSKARMKVWGINAR